MSAYEQALETLHKAPLGEFIALRGRLASEMRAHGDRPAAGRLVMRRRPSISAWTVNQLYWRARADFDDMLAAAERVRAGDREATGDYRRAIATLRHRSTAILKEAGHGATDAILGRVEATLVAIAAAGFGPDLPGTLATDRDPPGFDIGPVPRIRRAPKHTQEADHETKRDEQASADAAAARKERRAALQAEKRRAAERARLARERQRIERELGAARAEVSRREHALVRLRAELRDAQKAVEQAQGRVQDLERSLGDLDEGR